MFERVFAGLALPLLGWAAAGAAELNFQPGKWQMTTRTSIAGRPTSDRRTVTQCLTKDDFVPKLMREEDKNCSLTDRQTQGNTVTWVMECPNPNGGSFRAEGKIEYRGRSLSGEMKMTTNVQGQPMTIDWSMQGKRIGACD
jgi:hypothetical protein